MKRTPLRIALISEHASPLVLAGGAEAGGQNVYVAHVARGLAAAGHQVDVLTRRDTPTLPPAVDVQRGMRVVHLDAGPASVVPREGLLPHMPAFTEAARRLLARSQPYDVLHANFFMSGWAGLALRHRFQVPLVTSFHGLGLVRRAHHGPADQFPADRIDIERTLAQESDRVIAACPQDELDLLRLYQADPDRITNVPCSVDVEAFRPGDRAQARQRLGLPADAFVVLQLGRLVPRKGIDTVVQALALVRQARPEVPALLQVVGGGSREPDEQLTPEIARLRQLAHSLGIGDRVHFSGQRQREELRDHFLAADVFVTTPWYEPFGIAALEAMACGTPVVGSAVGGVRYTVADGVTGFLVPPRDPQALAARLLHLQANPALAAAMGRAGVRRVRSQFTWKHVTERLVRVYDSLRETAALPHAQGAGPALQRAASALPGQPALAGSRSLR
jgi:glycosyltransferase involved in cell wall biosynthesis